MTRARRTLGGLSCLVGVALSAAELPLYCNGESQFIPFPKTCKDSNGRDVPQKFIGYGSYTSVMPNGEYAIVSTDNQAVILDLRSWTRTTSPQQIPCIVTPLLAEPYPVGPDWELISSSPLDGHMTYFSFADILAQKEKAQAVLVDPQHTEQYQSHSILKKTADTLEFQTMIYSQLKLRKYQVFKRDGKWTSDPKKSFGAIVALSPSRQITEPILSRHGRYVGGLYRKPGAVNDDLSTTRIFALEKNSLRQILELPYATAKVHIADSGKGRPSVVYAAIVPINLPGRSDISVRRVIELYDAQRGAFQLLSFPWRESEAGYPNLLLDNRVIYTARRGDSYGLVRIDPSHYPKPDAGSKSSNQSVNSYLDCFRYYNAKGERLP